MVHQNSRRLLVEKNSANNLMITCGDGKPRLPPPTDPVCTQYASGNVVGTDNVQGFATVHTAVITNNERSEYWTAPSLGCMTLKEPHQIQDAGQWTGRTATEATRASTQEPPGPYFEIPADAKEVRPTEYR